MFCGFTAAGTGFFRAGAEAEAVVLPAVALAFAGAEVALAVAAFGVCDFGCEGTSFLVPTAVRACEGVPVAGVLFAVVEAGLVAEALWISRN